MADAAFTVTSFLGGEWSPEAQGRIDLPSYKTAMNVCLNGLPKETGAWTRRPGSKLTAVARGGARARVISFDFQQNYPYNIELTTGYLRFHAGDRLATTNDKQTVTAISTANPASVTVASAWATGSTVMFTDLGVNNPLLQNRQFLITHVDGTHFTIADAVTGANIDGATLGTFVSGNVVRVQELASPYAGTDWNSVRSVQALETAVFLHGTYQPQVVSVSTEPASGVDAQFAINPLTFLDGPYLDPFTNGVQVTPAATTGIVQLTLSFPAYSSTTAYPIGAYVSSSSVNYKSLIDQNLNNTPASSPTAWQAVSAASAIGPNGFTGSDIGRHVRLFSEPSAWAIGTSYAAGNVVKYNNAYYTWTGSTTTATATNAPGLTTSWGVNPTAAIWSWGKITSLLNQISQSLSGATNIGDMTGNGGLAASFDGVTTQSSTAASRQINTRTGSGSLGFSTYVGRNFSSASDQQIASATIFPTTDKGIAFLTVVGQSGTGGINGCTATLYGSATAPSSATDGTVLGTATVPVGPQISGTGPFIAGASPVSITSTDQSTAWKYVWVALLATANVGLSDSSQLEIFCAELQLFNPTGTGSGAAVKVQILGPSLLYTTSITTWRLGLYSNTTGWPSCGTYHEGRLWLSGAVSNRIDASVPNSIANNSVNFAPTASDGTVSSSSAISYTFNSPDTNPIYWMTPEQQGIVCGTKAGEWLVQASSQNNILTPTSIQAHRATRIGCANIEPRRTEHTLVFVQKFQRKIMEYFSDVFSGKYTAPNLSKDAKHLTTAGIAEIAYQQELVPIIWARMNDGSLVGGTYKRDTLMTSQGPTFMGWHPHSLGGNHSVESICVGPSTDGTLDTLAMVTADLSATTPIRMVSILTNVPDETTTLAGAWHLDCGIVPSFTQNVTIGGVNYFQCGGLWPHEGMTVTVYAGGLDLGDHTVSGGVVNVPYAPGTNAANTSFTQAFVSGYTGTMPVVVGFNYTSDGQLVRPAAVAEVGARNPEAIGTKGRIQSYAALLANAKGMKFGTSFSRLKTAIFRTEPDGGNSLGATDIKNGLHKEPLTDSPSFDGMICWRIERPFPATIAALTGFTKEE